MKVISAKQETPDGDEAVTPEQYQEDYPKIEKMHKEMLEQSSTWQVFGGTVRIGNRIYQVC